MTKFNLKTRQNNNGTYELFISGIVNLLTAVKSAGSKPQEVTLHGGALLMYAIL